MPNTSSLPGAVCIPLAGIRMVDFSTSLPGPMCSLLMAQAGAEVRHAGEIAAGGGSDAARSRTRPRCRRLWARRSQTSLTTGPEKRLVSFSTDMAGQ
ncbi:MAG: CoA transferase [Acidovorax defluvii]